MALFRKKPPIDDGSAPEAEADFIPQPDKAAKWFQHARTSADSFNFDYALSCYASGLRLDPTTMSAHVAMLEVAVRYVNNGGKPAPGKEIRSFEDGTPMGKFIAAEFEWMKDLKNPKVAIKTLDAAVKAKQIEYGNWIAPRVYTLIRGQKKHSKGQLMQAMQLFRAVGAWDESLSVGEMARELDPSDSDLDVELKNLTAQRAMDQGGYDAAVGEEGGFLQSVKDIEKQKELIEEESLSGGGTAEERNLERARHAYEENPLSPENINKYAQLIKKQATPEAEQKAYDLYMKGFEEIGEYRFRMYAGDIKIEALEWKIRRLDEKLEQNPDDVAAQSERDAAWSEILELKEGEYTERIKRYPTDRFRKYDLGAVLFELGKFGDAMEQFQASKDEPKLRVRAGHLLGKCFLSEQWYPEAIGEFEEALSAIDATEKERELALKYDLMLALLESAREDSSLEAAKQAKEICSEIARKNIAYRDIRIKRKEVDEVIKGFTPG